MQSPIPLPKMPGWLDDFKAFVMRGNVVDLAVGVIIGTAFTGIVSSLVKDIFNPIIGILVGGIDFSNVFVALDGKSYASLDAAKAAGAATLNIGLFINAIIQFVIVAFVVFWLIRALNRLMRKAPPPAPAPSPSEEYLREIRDLLKSRA
jgi:large conductance mechanosensitive channel